MTIDGTTLFESPANRDSLFQQCTPNIDHPVDFASLTENDQEQTILSELLYALLGFPTTHIKITQSGLTHPSTLSPSLAVLVAKMYPTISAYLALKQFIETAQNFTSGQILHALSGALRDVLKEYLVLVCALEDHIRQGFTLQKMWVWMNKTGRLLVSLHEFVASVQNTRGGLVLDHLSKYISKHAGYVVSTLSLTHL